METDIIAIADDANLSMSSSSEKPIKGKLYFLRINQSTSLNAFVLKWKPLNSKPVKKAPPMPEVMPPFPEQPKPSPPPAYEEIRFNENGFPFPLMTQDEYLKKIAQASNSTPNTLSTFTGLTGDSMGPSIPIDATNASTTSHTECEEKCSQEGLSVVFSDIECIKMTRTEHENKALVKLHNGEVLPQFVFSSTKELGHMLQMFEIYMKVIANGDTYRFAETENKLNKSIIISMAGTSQFKLQHSNNDDGIAKRKDANNAQRNVVNIDDDDDDDDDDALVVTDSNGNIPGENVQKKGEAQEAQEAQEEEEEHNQDMSLSLDGFTVVNSSSGDSVVLPEPKNQNGGNFGNQVVGFLNKGYKYIGKVFTEQKAIYEKKQAQNKLMREYRKELNQDPTKPHRIVEITEDNPFAGFKIYMEHELPEFSFLRCCSNGVMVEPCNEHDGTPMGVMEFFELFDYDGRFVEGGFKTLQMRGFYTGFSEDIQSEAWKLLLGFYPLDSTSSERDKINAERSESYNQIKAQWKSIAGGDQKGMTSEFARDLVQIDKDAVRTDREHRIFKEMDKVNELHDILASYVSCNQEMGYVQGMNDLCAIIMDVMMTDEAMTFWTFRCLMSRVESVFSRDQIGVKTRLLAISRILRIVDPELHEYLTEVGASEMYFCYRWILVLFKREFDFIQTKLLWEPILSNYMTKRFELFIACAMVIYLRSDIIMNKLSFDQILHFVNLFGSEHLFPCHKIVTLADLIYTRFYAEVGISKSEQDRNLLSYLLGETESFASEEEIVGAFEQN